jgi:hypothetical protein
MDVLIPGEVVQMALGACHDESGRKDKRASTWHFTIVLSFTTKPPMVQIEEVAAVIGT